MADVKVTIKYEGGQYTIDRDNGLKNTEILSQFAPSNDDIYYGMIAGSGTLEIIDYDSQLRSLINNYKLEPSSTTINILLDNNNVYKNILEHVSYQYNSNLCKFNLTDNISLIYDIPYIKESTVSQETTILTILKYCFDALKISKDKQDKALSKKILYGNNNYGTIESYLSQIKTPYYISKDINKVGEIIDDICEVAQLQISLDENSDLIIDSARPLISANQVANAIIIPKNKQFGSITFDIVQGAQYTSVAIKEKTTDTGIVYGEDDLQKIEDYDNVFVKTDEYNKDNPEIQKWYEKYNINELKLDDNRKALFGSFELDALSNSDYSIIQGESEPFCVMKLNYSYLYTSSPSLTNLDKVVGGECKQYKSITDFNIDVLNADWNDENLFFMAGFISDKQGTDSGFFNKTTTYVFAIKKQWRYEYSFDRHDDIVINQAQLFYGMDSLVSKTLTRDDDTIYGDGDKTYSASSNDLFDTTFTYNEEPISKVFANNILNDYAKPIKGASITVSYSDYSNMAGTTIIQDGSGEYIKKGNIVIIDGVEYRDNSPIYWKVTSSKFRKSACPFIDLELMEIKSLTTVFKNYTIPSRSWSGVICNNNEYIIWAFNGIFKSSNLINWGNNLNPSGTINKLKLVDGKLFRLNADLLYYSIDNGDTWKEAYIDRIIDRRDIAYNGENIYVTVGYAESGFGYYNASYSTDGGLNWTAVHIGEKNTFHMESVCYGNGKFVTGAYNISNKIYYSVDGKTWNYSKLDSECAIQSIAFGNGIFLISAETIVDEGIKPIILISKDGVVWNVVNVDFIKTNTSATIRFLNNNFILETSGVMAYSNDGANWLITLISEYVKLENADFDGDNYIAIKNNNTLAKFNINRII